MTQAQDPIEVMLVDDSAVIRGLLSRTLEKDPQIAVVASVANGKMAIDSLKRRPVDVIVLDIEMPIMDGLEALPKLLATQPGVQIIMASTLTRRNADISLQALRMGASDYIPKPTANSEIHSSDVFGRELTDKVKALGAIAQRSRPAGSRPATAARAVRTPSRPAAPQPTKELSLRPLNNLFSPEIIAIGSSTGGPQALAKFFSGLPAMRQPILITQHMPATFTALLAEHLDKVTPMTCREATEGDRLVGGEVLIAPGGRHMTVEEAGGERVIRLKDTPPENYCRPSVDPMLRSLIPLYGSRILVVILTGMGADGCKGSELVVKSGGVVVAQDEASSVVWGMPGAVATQGLCSAVVPLGDMANVVRKLVMRSAA